MTEGQQVPPWLLCPDCYKYNLNALRGILDPNEFIQKATELLGVNFATILNKEDIPTSVILYTQRAINQKKIPALLDLILAIAQHFGELEKKISLHTDFPLESPILLHLDYFGHDYFIIMIPDYSSTTSLLPSHGFATRLTKTGNSGKDKPTGVIDIHWIPDLSSSPSP